MGRRYFDGWGQANDFKYRRQSGRRANLEKLDWAGVAKQAAVVGGMVRFGFRN